MRLVMSAEEVTAHPALWHKNRLTGIGGSEIGTVCLLEGHHGSPWKLWAQKTGRLTEPPTADRRLEFGNYCENFIAWCLETDRPDLHLTPGGLYRHDTRAWQIATFDRLAHTRTPGCGGDGACLQVPAGFTVQMKTDAGWRDWERDGMPDSYLAQCVWEAAIAGTPVALLPVFDRVAADVTHIMRVTMDDEAERYLDALLEGAETFWEFVTTDTPPPMDGSKATTDALRQLYPGVDKDLSVRVPTRLASRWRRASFAVKTADERRRRYLNQLMIKVGGSDGGTLPGIWTVRDPGGGPDIKIASVSASPRAGYEVRPKESIVAVHPSRKWKP